MKTVRRYWRTASWYSAPRVVSRLSLVTVPYSSTPVSSGDTVNLPTPHSSATSRRLKSGYLRQIATEAAGSAAGSTQAASAAAA
eukprot:7328998-Prymnesium_polylepis.1